MRLLIAILVVLIGLVQVELWFGRGGLPHVMSLQGELAGQEALNADARLRNARTAAEVADLKEGLEMVEESARWDLGMVKPDELLVVVSPPRR